jgi:hypothetical protein
VLLLLTRQEKKILLRPYQLGSFPLHQSHFIMDENLFTMFSSELAKTTSGGTAQQATQQPPQPQPLPPQPPQQQSFLSMLAPQPQVPVATVCIIFRSLFTYRLLKLLMPFFRLRL